MVGTINLMYLLYVSTGLYITITVASLVRFVMVGVHNAVFALSMLSTLVPYQLGLLDVDTTLNIVCALVGPYTVYNLIERLKHV